MGQAVPIRDRLERTHYGSPDGNHPAPRLTRCVDRARGLSRDTVEFLEGGSSFFEAGDTVCNMSGTTLTPLATRRVINSGVNALPAEGISAYYPVA